MIAYLRGNLIALGATSVVVDVGGVGYKVSVPVTTLNALPSQGEPTALHISTYVREDEIALFGFAHVQDKHVFELLISVSGIGPKVAISILSAMDSGSLARAVIAEDTKALVRIPGLGLKTAQRLILELRDKLAASTYGDADALTGTSKPGARSENIADDVVEGLIGLGYHRADARRAADRAVRELSDKSNMAAALKAALNLLTGADSR